MQRVDLQEDKSYTARFPKEQPVTVRIMMTRRHVPTAIASSQRRGGETAHGGRVAGKFFELGEPVWGQPVTQKLYDGLMKLESIADFRVFADGFSL